MHLVARCAGAAGLATGRYSWRLVVPDRQKRAIGGHRKVRLPLGLGRLDIAVELEWGAEGHSAVSRTNVENVAGVAGGGVAGRINIVHHTIVSSRLTPALVPPVKRAVIHAGEKARSAATGPWEGGADIGVGPSVAAVGGTVDAVGTVAESPTHLVHTGDVNIAVGEVAGDLHVADKGIGDLSLVSPCSPVVSRKTYKQSASPNIEIVK